MNKTPDKDGAMWGRPMAACCSTRPAAAGFRDMPVKGTDVAPTSLPEEPPLRFIPGEAAPYFKRHSQLITHEPWENTNALQAVRGKGI